METSTGSWVLSSTITQQLKPTLYVDWDQRLLDLIAAV